MRIQVKYLIICCLLLGIEIIIALYVRDTFVRPYLGDSIAIAFVYTFLMSMVKTNHTMKPQLYVASISLLIGIVIELLQATSFLETTGLGNIHWVRVVMGTSFSWFDMLAYVGGYLGVILVEWMLYKKSLRP